MGPFELIDLIGLDVNLTIARSFFSQGGKPERWRPSPIQERLVEEGRLGRKSGQGYYAYGDGIEREADPELEIAAPTLDPEQLEAIDPAAEEILARLFAQIANEAAFALEERVASPEDMDTATRLGLNWPLGALGIGALLGPARAVTLLEQLEQEKGVAYAPAPLLRRNSGSSG
jgi:3-hydroxybutyryl-CoA dehydrogenase